MTETVGEARRTRAEYDWGLLCDRHLPMVIGGDFVWRMNTEATSEEPCQGWKLHISATIFDACDVMRRVAPVVTAARVRFKAPGSLAELAKINSGHHYGYEQVGKFITIYPSTPALAKRLAVEIHSRTSAFVPVKIPFDAQYLPNSSVFYRYGAFKLIEGEDKLGRSFFAIRDPSGHLVPDNRRLIEPDWIPSLFEQNAEPHATSFVGTPLGKTYRIFRALSQRGKGGTYLAVSVQGSEPVLCVIKEGRRGGEMAWNRLDGRDLVANEGRVLRSLESGRVEVPSVFGEFAIGNNQYVAMEHIAGATLRDHMSQRKRRYSVRKIISMSTRITQILTDIHAAGWIWNDCKPANLIVVRGGGFRPIDFEGAYRIGTTCPFDWQTAQFASPNKSKSSGVERDLYALGCLMYFLIAGRLYSVDDSVPVRLTRKNMPKTLSELTEGLLSSRYRTADDVLTALSKI